MRTKCFESALSSFFGTRKDFDTCLKYYAVGDNYLEIMARRIIYSLSPLALFGGGSIATREYNSNWDHRLKVDAGKEGKGLKTFTNLFLVRHGQYVANDKRLSGGQTTEVEEFDDNDQLRPLTTLGKEQAVLTGKRLAEILEHEGFLANESKSVKIISSDSRRARGTISRFLSVI